MSELVSSAQLAEMALPILPKSKQGIEHVAKRDGWPFEYIKGQGRGGRLKKFVLSGLSEEIQTAVRERQAEQLLAQSQPAVLPSVAKAKRPVAVRRMEQLGLPIDDYAMGLNDKQRDCAHARMALAAEVLRLHEVTGFGITDAVDFVVRQVESGQLSETLAYLVPVANARANNQRGISVRTLKGWVAAYRAAGSPNARLAALAPRPTKTETPVVQIAWLADFMAHHCRPSAPKLAHSYQEFAKGWLTTQPAYELPSLDTVRRVWKKLPQIMQQRGRMTGAAYKSLQPYIRRDWQALRPNDVWIGDGHSFKAKVQHPIHGQPFKPEVTVIIDGCTRMVVGFSFSLAESCVAVADALRIGIKHNGVPLMYYSDNGGGQTGKTIDHEITGLTARLGIHHETGLPGNPQGRGIIERWWQDNLIRLAAQYETFTGSSMDRSTQNLLYPMALKSNGAITERWLIRFTGENTFQLYGETLGLVVQGDTVTDLAPPNPATGKPYFTLPAAAFGGGWSAGNCIRFNTYGTPMPVWILRSVQPSAARQTEKDGFTACLRGNTVAE